MNIIRNAYQIIIVSILFLVSMLATSGHAAKLDKNIVDSNGHPMALWHKKPKGVFNQSKQILLLHGRTWSSLPDFDLQVEGEQLSVMDNLVKLGFSVWSLDARGYGATPRDKSGWNTPNKASQDVANVIRWITKTTGNKPVVFGWSYGSVVAQLTVQKNPDIAKAVVLYGYPVDVVLKGIDQKLPNTPPRKKNTRANAISDFIVEGAISKKAIATYANESLKADPYRADWNQLQQWTQLDAKQITIPLLLLQGEHDPLAISTSHAKLFIDLPNANKQWIVLAGGDHAALLETPKDRLVHSINDFVNWLSR